MRILFVCNEYPPTTHGGIGVIVKDLAEGLSERGYQTAVLGYDPLIKKARREDENGVWVTRLPMKRYFSLRLGHYRISPGPFLSRKHLSKQLEELITEFKPDLIESYDWSGPLWYKPSKKLVVRMHGANTAHQFYENKRPGRLLGFLERRNVKNADALCAVSNHIGQLTLRAMQLTHLEYTCIHNFVDTKKFKPIKNIAIDFSKLLYVGRVHPRKGLLELFYILKELFEINDDVYLELVGPYEEEYKKMLINFLPEHQRYRVHFVGRVRHEKLPRIINSSGLFVMPSRAEAFGITAIEAMACGVPVLLTDKASGPEIVEEGKTGWLMNIDDPISSAQKIDRLLRQPELLDQTGKRGLNHVIHNFSKDVMLDKNILFYQDLLA